MSKKILMLSMSCNDPYFQGLLACVRDTWAKPLIQNKYENISWWSYTACNEKHPYEHIDFENHMIYVDCPDDIKSTYIKTKRAYELIKSTGIDFNYVVRTNTSIFVNIDNMIKRINSIDNDSIIGNWCPLYKDDINGNSQFVLWFFIGFFACMKREYFDMATSSDTCYMVNPKNELEQENDDIIMSLNLFDVINEINASVIEPDGRIAVYKGILPYDEIDPKLKYIQNFDYIDDPNIVNDRVIVRVRTYYRDHQERISKGHEIEHFFELNDALLKK